MIVKFKGKFRRDLIKIQDKSLNKAVRTTIENVKRANHISQIDRLVKLKDYKIHFRIEIPGNYRIGLIIKKDTVWFSRVLHRNTIYKKFP